MASLSWIMYQPRPLAEDELKHALLLTLRPPPCLILVTGSSGTGKTTLVRHVLRNMQSVHSSNNEESSKFYILQAKFDQARQQQQKNQKQQHNNNTTTTTAANRNISLANNTNNTANKDHFQGTDSSSNPILKALERMLEQALKQNHIISNRKDDEDGNDNDDEKTRRLVEQALDKAKQVQVAGGGGGGGGPYHVNVESSLVSLFPVLKPYHNQSTETLSSSPRAPPSYLRAGNRSEGTVQWHTVVLEFVYSLVTLAAATTSTTGRRNQSIDQGKNEEAKECCETGDNQESTYCQHSSETRQEQDEEEDPLRRKSQQWVFFLDDLQWCDEESLQWIRSILILASDTLVREGGTGGGASVANHGAEAGSSSAVSSSTFTGNQVRCRRPLPFSVIGACRKNEIPYKDATASTTSTLANWMQTLKDECIVSTIKEICLDDKAQQLSAKSIRNLVSLYLGFDYDDEEKEKKESPKGDLPLSVVDRIAHFFESEEAVGGNHLFLMTEILQSLADAKQEILHARPELLEGDAHDEKIIGEMLWERLLNMVGESVAASNRGGGDQVADFFLCKTMSLPQDHRNVLQAAACVGTEFEPRIVDLALGRKVKDFDRILLEMERWRLVDRSNKDHVDGDGDDDDEYDDDIVYYRFPHDKVQQAMLDLIVKSGSSLEAYCLKIGRRLWHELTQIGEVDAYCGLIVYLISRGLDLVTKTDERIALAELFHYAGLKARTSCSFLNAKNLFRTSLSLLPPCSWNDEYQLTLNIYNSCSEISLLLGEFDAAQGFADTILANAISEQNKFSAYLTHIYALGGELKYGEAVVLSISILTRFGVFIPKRFIAIRSLLAYRATTFRVRQYTPQAILNMRKMADPNMIASQHLISLAVAYSFMARSSYMLYLGVKLVDMSLDFGISEASCIGYALLSFFAGNLLNQKADQYAFGDLAVKLAAQESSASLYAGRVAMVVNGLTNLYNFSMRECVRHLEESFRIGYQNGDMFFCLTILSLRFAIGTQASEPLHYLQKQMSLYKNLMTSYHQEAVSWGHLANMQAVDILCLDRVQTTNLSGSHMKEEDMIEQARARGVPVAVEIVEFFKCFTNFALGNYEIVADLFLRLHPKLTRLMATSSLWCVVFYGTTSQLILATKPGQSRRSHLCRAKRGLRELAVLANESPENNMCRYLIVLGQWHVVHSENSIGLSKLQRADTYAVKEGMLLEAGICRELKAKIHFAWGDLSEARRELRAALAVYEQWGAAAKITKLQSQWKTLLVR